MILEPAEISARGAFYAVRDAERFLFWVATHTYQKDGVWLPKTPAGTYTCRRGVHQIPTGEKFDTFEVLGVPGHTGILFVHPGNLPQKDSDGCFICGMSLGYVGSERSVIMSRNCFENAFSTATKGLDEFDLTIKDSDVVNS